MDLMLGVIIYLGFVMFRGMKGFEFYHARLVRSRGSCCCCCGLRRSDGGCATLRACTYACLSLYPALSAAAAPPPPPHTLQLLPAVSRKPPQLKLHGHQRFWGWLQPVFRVTDEELVRTAGLDALIAVSVRQWRRRVVVVAPPF